MDNRGTVDRFVAGAIGEPGERVFLLQFDLGGELATFLLEKGQVAALAEQSLELLDQAGFAGAGEGLEPGELVAPVDIEFRVAAMQLTYTEDTGLVALLLGSTEEDTEPIAYELTPAQLDAAARIGREAVAAGRPICPHCGLAKDRGGHNCPIGNGDLRGHRP